MGDAEFVHHVGIAAVQDGDDEVVPDDALDNVLENVAGPDILEFRPGVV
jgi:hypothetical protein